MVQTVKTPNGEIHEFPDDASPGEMNAALDASDRQSKIDRFKNATGIGQPSMGQNIAAGALHGLQSMVRMLPDMSSMMPESMQNALPYKPGERPIDNFDAYKAMGTTDQPFYTPQGAAQTFGEYLIPGRIAAKAYSPAKNAILKLVDKISPEKHAEQMVSDISQGAKNLPENATSLGNDIRNGYNMRNEESSVFLNHALDRAGKEEIYDFPNPLISTDADKAQNIIGKIKNLGDFNTSDLFKAFKEKPSFENGHKLQSELGNVIGQLEKKPGKSVAEANELNQIKGVRDTLKNDIMDFLDKRDLNSNENLASTYQKGIDIYRDNVSPYLSDKKLRDIVRGGKETVKNIHSIFDTPTNIIDRVTGESKIGPVNKIMQDLPQESKNKIIYSAIGGKPKDANSLLKVLSKAKNRGFSSYFTPEMQEQMSMLDQKIHNKNILKGVGITAGAGAALAGTNKILSTLSNLGSQNRVSDNSFNNQ